MIQQGQLMKLEDLGSYNGTLPKDHNAAMFRRWLEAACIEPTPLEIWQAAYATGTAAEREACKQIVSEEAYGHDPTRMADRIIEAIEARGKEKP